jgi:mannose-6-phosphate isomerase class I
MILKPGEFYFIPAGTVHTISSGILAYETMQSSDITYRLYDYTMCVHLWFSIISLSGKILGNGALY